MSEKIALAGAPIEAGHEQKTRIIAERFGGAEGYEHRSPWLFIVFPIAALLIIWAMAKRAVKRLLGRLDGSVRILWFDGFGSKCRELKQHAATWRSINIIYNRSEVASSPGFGGVIDRFWWTHTTNGRAVRNRLKIAKRELLRAVAECCDDEPRIMSLAAGTAQGVIETLAELKRGGRRAKVLLIDIDPTALAYARELAKRYFVEDMIETREGNALLAAKSAREFEPHVIEVMGLLDYLSDEEVVRLMRGMRRYLARGGRFITCNIHPNLERLFMEWVIEWKMIYRTPARLARLAEEAGYDDVTMFVEPLGLHGVLLAKA